MRQTEQALIEVQAPYECPPLQGRTRVGYIFGFQESAMGGKLVRTIGITRARTKIGMMNLVYNIRRLLRLARNGIPVHV